MAPEFQYDGSPGQIRPALSYASLDLSAGGPFFAPFWAIFGFFEPQVYYYTVTRYTSSWPTFGFCEPQVY